LAQFDRENQSCIKRSIVKDKGGLFSNQKQYNSDIKNRSNQQAIQEEPDSKPLAEIRKEINFNEVEVRKPRCVVDPDEEKGFPQDPKIISKKIIKLLIGSQKPIARTGRLLQKQLFTPIIKKPPQNPVKDYNIFIRPFTLTEQDDPTGLYMTGKFIGVDCYWNGSNLVSSCGTKYTPPSKFISEFPPGYHLIGTLYLPNANSTHYQAILAHTGNKSCEWLQLKFKVCDLIRHDMPFKMRLQKLKEMFKETSFIEICNYRECKSKKDLQDELQKVKSIGGKAIYLKHLNMPFKGGKAGGFYEFK